MTSRMADSIACERLSSFSSRSNAEAVSPSASAESISDGGEARIPLRPVACLGDEPKLIAGLVHPAHEVLQVATDRRVDEQAVDGGDDEPGDEARADEPNAQRVRRCHPERDGDDAETRGRRRHRERSSRSQIRQQRSREARAARARDGSTWPAGLGPARTPHRLNRQELRRKYNDGFGPCSPPPRSSFDPRGPGAPLGLRVRWTSTNSSPTETRDPPADGCDLRGRRGAPAAGRTHLPGDRPAHEHQRVDARPGDDPQAVPAGPDRRGARGIRLARAAVVLWWLARVSSRLAPPSREALAAVGRHASAGVFYGVASAHLTFKSSLRGEFVHGLGFADVP